tara:strand:+ start:7512 stop:7712 length:201 start_codon:yes stop_codon:yes gene_type:complete
MSDQARVKAHREFLRYHYGDDVPVDMSSLNDFEILRNDIDRLDRKFDQVTKILSEVLTEIKKINTL